MMGTDTLEQRVKGIAQMEFYYDVLCLALRNNPDLLKEDPPVKAMLDQLTDYYQNGQWLQDYTLDEQGMLPPELKRGVLSQDGVFNLLDRI